MSSVIEFSTVNQDRAFFDLIQPQYISWEFYSQYLDTEPPFGAIGDIVDCRTYRRFIPELNRREKAVEAFLRVTDYNMSLVAHLQDKLELIAEAQLMFDALFNLKALPSNRSRWVGGTESVKKAPSSIFNCSFTAINRIEAFGDVFNLLCLGVGVGFRVFKRDIKQLPKIRNKKLTIQFKDYVPKDKRDRLESTITSDAPMNTLCVTVGDSREGWQEAIMQLLKCFTEETDIRNIYYIFDSVRPFGERVLGFGGKASGYKALQGILQKIHKIIIECPEDFLRSIDCLDINCIIAEGAIAGNSRRSALICLFDENDDLCRNAKTDWPLLEAMGKTYRSQSNNTCCIGSIHYDAFIELLATDPTEEQVLDFLERVKPSKEFFDNAFQVMRALGEPAIDHFLLMVYKRYLAARKYRPNEDFRLYVDVSTNPCFAPGTMIKTKTGDFAIESLIGKIVDVWDGEQWVTIDNFRVTGKNQKVYKVTLWDNVKQEYFYVCTTLSHNFVLADGNKKELKDLVPGHELLFTDISKTHRVYFRALEFDHLAEKVYCCTVPTNNQITLANGLITGNCHEIIGTIGLDKRSGSYCNLTTSDLVKCVKIDNSRLPTYHQISESEVVETYSNSTKYYFDYSEYEQLVRLMVRTGIRQTEVNVPMRGWNETQRKERLLGVDAVNGFQDAIALLGWKFDDENSSDLRRKIRQWANDEADKYSAKLGIERPLLVTCVKPNGNTGAVLGVSSGIHWGWDSHYMRRVTCNAQDSLSKTLLDQGFTAYPANNDSQLGTKLQKMYFDSLSTLVKADIMANIDASKVEAVWVTAYDLIDLKLIQFPTQTLLDYYTTLPKETQLDILNSCNSIVFEFPIKTTANKSCNEVSAIDQLKNQFLFSTEYTDHLPSVTITVKSHEWEDVVDWVFAYWNKGFITASFFSFFEESYPLLANQSISEEEYGKALLNLIENARGVKRLDTTQGTRYAFMLDEDLLNRYESGVGFKEEEDLKVDNCTTGCPIK